MTNVSTARKSSITLSTAQKTLIGYLLGLIAHLSFCSQNYFTKKVQLNLTVGQTQYFTFLQLGIYSYFIAPSRGAPVVYKNKKATILLIARSLMGIANTYLIFTSLKLIPLSEATVIGMIGPVITAGLSTFFFNEKFERVILINGGLGIIGVMLIAKPAFIFGSVTAVVGGEGRTIGIMISIFCAFFGSTIQIVIKKCGALAHPISMTYYFGILTALIAPIFLVIEGDYRALTFRDAINLLFCGLFGAMAHVSLNTAYQFGEAGKIALLQYTQIIFAFLYEIVIDNRRPDDYSIMGTGSILVGFLVLVYKTIKKPAQKPQQPEQEQAKELGPLKV